MSASTIKREIWNALDNLRQSDFSSFCSVLQDRREEPRVLRRDVEGKSREDVADRLVSVFTEPKALLVTLSILRQIRCNEEALGLGECFLICSYMALFISSDAESLNDGIKSGAMRRTCCLFWSELRVSDPGEVISVARYPSSTRVNIRAR